MGESLRRGGRTGALRVGPKRLSGITPDWDWAKAAVVAREWRYLQPVRSYCEARGIPVQMANADLPGFWWLRETQQFTTWLRGRARSAVQPEELRAWLSGQADVRQTFCRQSHTLIERFSQLGPFSPFTTDPISVTYFYPYDLNCRATMEEDNESKFHIHDGRQ